MTNMAVIYKDAFGNKNWKEVRDSDWTMTDDEVKALFDKQTTLAVYEVVDVFSMEEVDLADDEYVTWPDGSVSTREVFFERWWYDR